MGTKKGGAQQLQAEINSDDDLYRFLERPGVLVLDVYSEWCGPCLAMVGSLRKIKLELGGDNLHLAICKSDTIEALKRFRNKSEPTWLIATHGKCVNLMFGTDVPKLMKIITEELRNLDNTKRQFYDITELQPEEKARKDVIEKKIADARNKEIEEAARQKLEYRTYVTNEILANLSDIGVTIFGPHINRDLYKKIMEVAETQKISCKDRRQVVVMPEHFELINYFCENPIEPEILEHLYQKDLLVCFWKISDNDHRGMNEILLTFAHELTHPRKVILDTGEVDPTQTLPVVLTPLEIKIARPLDGGPEKEPPHPHPSPAPHVKEKVEDPITEIAGAEPLPGEDTDGETKESPTDEAHAEETASAAESVDTEIILIPPVWTPSDVRTHAMLIYVFFRAQTTSFLPPDPVPDPPHIVMAFDAHKKKDIFQVVEKHKENVLLYGFFTNSDPQSAKLIASSLISYETKTPQVTDKLILKVAKRTSHTMLAFAEFGPSYISANTVVGKEEALKLFPEGFVNVEHVVEEEKVVVAETSKKKSKESQKSKKGDAEGRVSAAE